MKTIWKFPVQAIIEIPIGAKILTVKTQNDKPYIWAEVDSEQPLEKRTFTVFGTGARLEYPKQKEYIGTYTECGMYEWHLYEVKGNIG